MITRSLKMENPALFEFEDTLENAIEKAYKKNFSDQKKGRKATGRNIYAKTYDRITISITHKQKLDIQNYAQQHYDGNVSDLIKSLLKKEQITKG